MAGSEPCPFAPSNRSRRRTAIPATRYRQPRRARPQPRLAALASMTEEIAVDTEELVEARWFDRGKIRGVVARANSATRTP